MKKYEITRSAKRVRVALPIHLEPGSGVTRDISQSGVYFFTEQPLSPGMTFPFVLELDYASPGEKVFLRCRGKVVRIEGVGKRKGVAASINEFKGTEKRLI